MGKHLDQSASTLRGPQGETAEEAAGFVEVIIETKLEKRKDMRTNIKNRRREEEMRKGGGREIYVKFSMN